MVRFLWLVGVLIAVVAGVGCGDDDDEEDAPSASPDPAIEQYFSEYLAINDEANARIAALDQTYPDAFKGDVQQTKDSFAEYVAIFDQTDDKYTQLDVPAELDGLHRDLADADADISEISHRRLALLANATSAEDVDAIFAEDPAFTDAVERGDSGCLALEANAADYQIAFDLPCEK